MYTPTAAGTNGSSGTTAPSRHRRTSMSYARRTSVSIAELESLSSSRRSLATSQSFQGSVGTGTGYRDPASAYVSLPQAFSLFLKGTPVLSQQQHYYDGIEGGMNASINSGESKHLEPAAFEQALERSDVTACRSAAKELYRMVYNATVNQMGGGSSVLTRKGTAPMPPGHPSSAHAAVVRASTNWEAKGSSIIAEPESPVRDRSSSGGPAPGSGGKPQPGALPSWISVSPNKTPTSSDLDPSVRSTDSAAFSFGPSHRQASAMVNAYGNEMIAEFEILAELGRGCYGVVNLAVDADDVSYAIKTVVGGGSRSGGNRARGGQKRRDSEASATSPPTSPWKLTPNTTPPSTDGLTAPVSGVFEPPPAMPALPRARPTAGAEREIAVMKKIRHKHLVRLHAVIEDPETHDVHMVMQYVENGPIAKVKDDGACVHTHTMAEVLAYMVQVSTGIDYLHKHHILHRDIKPDNILLGKDKQAFVADFGVSDMMDDGQGGGRKVRKALVGTMAFTSPELIESNDAAAKWGEASDVWAFGVTLYALLVKKLPFYGWNHPSLVKSILRDQVSFPEDCGIPGDLQALIKHGLLAKNPDDRVSLSFFRHHPVVEKLTGKKLAVHSSPAEQVLEQEPAPGPFPRLETSGSKGNSGVVVQVQVSEGSRTVSDAPSTVVQGPRGRSPSATFLSSDGSTFSSRTATFRRSSSGDFLPGTTVEEEKRGGAGSVDLCPLLPTGDDQFDLSSDDEQDMGKSAAALVKEIQKFKEVGLSNSMEEELADVTEEDAEAAIAYMPVSFTRRYNQGPRQARVNGIVSGFVSRLRTALTQSHQ